MKWKKYKFGRREGDDTKTNNSLQEEAIDDPDGKHSNNDANLSIAVPRCTTWVEMKNKNDVLGSNESRKVLWYWAQRCEELIKVYCD